MSIVLPKSILNQLLDFCIVVFRFVKDSGRVSVILKSAERPALKNRHYAKADDFYYFDRWLNCWHRFQKQALIKALGDFNQLEHQQYFFLLETPLSETQKEQLASGMDITVNVGVYLKSSKKYLGLSQINMVADYSFFLGQNSLPVSAKSLDHNSYLSLYQNLQ